jgi:hypothetical protein
LGETELEMFPITWVHSKQLIKWIDENTLEAIAYFTNWKYFRFTGKNSLDEILDEIFALENKSILDIINLRYHIFILFLILWLVIPIFYFKKIKFRKW